MTVRRSFSLIEVMVVIVLMGAVAGVSVFSLWPFFKTYRFRLEAEALYELLQELQLEAMTLQSDMYVHLRENGGKWVASSLTHEPIIKPQTVDLAHVDQVSIKGRITLYANGLVGPRNLLRLSGQGEHRWIDLRGGHLMKFCEVEPRPVINGKIPDLKTIRGQE